MVRVIFLIFLIDIIENEEATFLSLIDILFAYALEYRITGGEFTVESSWTISRISGTLAWFDVSTSYMYLCMHVHRM